MRLSCLASMRRLVLSCLIFEMSIIELFNVEKIRLSCFYEKISIELFNFENEYY